MGGRCEVCGNAEPRVLEFDHKRPIRRASSGKKSRPADSIREILTGSAAGKTFSLLCANCHRVKTHDGREWCEPFPDVVTETELAAWLSFTPEEVREFRLQGAGPPPINGVRGAVYVVDEVEDWIESCVVEPTREAIE